jgi:outer membrane protein assembly factor BamB
MLKNKYQTDFGYNLAKRIALAAAVFSFILSILLIVNYIQTKSVDPLNSLPLNQLILKLKETPDDLALKEQIRALDLLARKAYFISLWQIKTGGYLLFGFVIVFLASLKYMSSFNRNLPDFVTTDREKKGWEDRLLARKYLIYSLLTVFVGAFMLGSLAKDELADIVVTQEQISPVVVSSQSELEKNIGTVTETPGTYGGVRTFASPEEMRKNWPNFRGPDGTGVAYVSSAPLKWDGRSGDHIKWKTPIPVRGFNSPVIWGKKIFLSGADRKTQMVYCIDADTGKIIWEKQVNDIPGSPREKPETTPDTGLAAPTMASDGVRVYVIFGSGDVAALDFEGNRIWGKNLGVPENHYGHSSSLIAWNSLLLIQYDQNTGGRLIALSAETGDLVYDKTRNTGISWASPILVNTGERYELILNSNPNVISYDPATGKELLKVECMEGEVAPSLAYSNGMVFAVNEYARLVAISLEGTPKILWKSEDDLSEVSSPVATGDYLFVATSYGTLSCFDTKTGERYWFEDLPRGFYSSPVFAGGNIYLMDVDGKMYIIKPGREYNLLSTCEIGEKVVTVPAFMHGRIYIRGFDNLYCIE